MRLVILSKSEVEKLTNLHKNSKNSVERQRSQILLLSNHQKYSMSKIGKIVGLHPETISKLFDAWESAPSKERFSVLRYAKGQGAKHKLAPVKDILPDLLEKNNRDLKAVLYVLEKEHNITVSKVTLQNFLKETRL